MSPGIMAVIPKKFSVLALPHPAKILAPKITIPNRSEAIENARKADKFDIFTDASKSKNSPVGCAAIQKNEYGWESIVREPIHPSQTVFYGELHAIRKTMEHIAMWGEQNSYTIFSDSTSALQALKNPYSKDNEVQRILEIIREMEERGTSIHLTWCPGHEGVEGNELADQLAKELTMLPDQNQINYWNKCAVKNALREEIRL
jgi:ribonuclease HI